MKLQLLLAGILMLCISASAIDHIPDRIRGGKLWDLLQANVLSEIETPSAEIFTQTLDHFDLNNSAVFNQRYYENNEFWSDSSNPIILYIGGESTLHGTPGGFVTELAKEHNAKILALEHRFYGESVPSGDLSTPNLKYLTVEQALADLGYFRFVYASMKRLSNNKWFVVGGSYPGALAAWFRIAYPSASAGSLSSSGVVNAIFNFTGFDEQVAESAGEECASALRSATADFEKQIEEGKGNYAKGLLNAQNLSDPDFFYMIADGAAMAVQYGHKDKLCKPIVQASKDVKPMAEALAAFINEYYGPDFGSKCFYDTKCLKNDPSRWQDERSWRWQKCSQVAFFQTAPDENSLRSKQVNISYHLSQCKEVFGDAVDPEKGVHDLNQRFGGDQPTGNRVFFSNGGDDPWQRASVLKSLADDEPAYLAECDLCGHCGDLRADSALLPAPLVEQRRLIKKYVNQWLTESSGGVATLGEKTSLRATENGDLHTINEIERVERTSMLVLFPMFATFVALKLILHVDLIRDLSFVRQNDVV